jgi:hypothetical protein
LHYLKGEPQELIREGLHYAEKFQPQKASMTPIIATALSTLPMLSIYTVMRGFAEWQSN